MKTSEKIIKELQQEKRAEKLLQMIIVLSEENNKKDYQMTTYERITLESSLLLLKSILQEK